MSAPTASETTPLINSAQHDNLTRAMSNSVQSIHSDSIGETGLGSDDEDFETTYKREATILAKYSTPLIITYLLQYSYTLVAVFVAGQLGTNELGAISLAAMTGNITGLSLFEGLATALDTLASQAYGGGKKKLVGLHVQRMAALIIVMSPLIMLVWGFSPYVLQFIIPQQSVVVSYGQFMRIYLIGVPGYGLFEVVKRFTQAQGDFTASLIAVAICAPLNLFWNWLFVWKLELGFRGAALAPAVSFTLQPIVFVLYVRFFAKSSLECWPGFSIKQSFRNWGQMWKLGGSGILMILSEWFAFELLTLIASYIDTESLAAQSVLSTVAITMYHIPAPAAIAASTRFGNLIGHGALKAARKATTSYYVIFVGIGLFDLIFLSSMRNIIATRFSKDEKVRAIIIQAMPLMAGAQLFDALAALVNGLLRGLGRQHIGGFVNLATYYVWAVPLAVGLTFGGPKLGVIGLWLGPLSGLFVVTVAVSVYLRTTDWRKAVEEARARVD